MPSTVDRTFRAHPSSLFEVRQFIRGCAAQAGLDGAFADDIVLAVSEASANSVLHTNGPEFTVTLSIRDGCVHVDVSDRGVFNRRVVIPERDGHGRGIPLMKAMMDQVSIREGTEVSPGTRVRLVKCGGG